MDKSRGLLVWKTKSTPLWWITFLKNGRLHSYCYFIFLIINDIGYYRQLRIFIGLFNLGFFLFIIHFIFLTIFNTRSFFYLILITSLWYFYYDQILSKVLSCFWWFIRCLPLNLFKILNKWKLRRQVFFHMHLVLLQLLNIQFLIQRLILDLIVFYCWIYFVVTMNL